MSNTKEAFNILDELEEFGTKRKLKEELLGKNKQHTVLKQIFDDTYNWLRTYGLHVETPKNAGVKGKALFSGKSFTEEENWKSFQNLLAKYEKRELTGNAARDAWSDFITGCSGTESKWYTRILNRDLRIGVGFGTINKIWPGMLSSFACQLSGVYTPKSTELVVTPVEKKKDTPFYETWWHFPMWVEPKLDGMRVILVCKEGKGIAFSRSAIELPNLQFLADAVADTIQNGVFDGEIFGKSWNYTMSLVKSEKSITPEQVVELKTNVRYWAFDYINLVAFQTPIADYKGFGRDPRPLTKRRDLLEKKIARVKEKYPNINIAPTPREIVEKEEDIEQHFKKALEDGFEGVMLKYPDAPYDCWRSDNWLKYKPLLESEGGEVTATIVGFRSGTGRNEERLGALVVQLEDGTEFRIGSGFSDKQRDEIWSNQDKYMGMKVDFEMAKDPVVVAKARFPIFVRIKEDH